MTGQYVFYAGIGLLALTLLLAVYFLTHKVQYRPDQVSTQSSAPGSPHEQGPHPSVSQQLSAEKDRSRGTAEQPAEKREETATELLVEQESTGATELLVEQGSVGATELLVEQESTGATELLVEDNAEGKTELLIE